MITSSILDQIFVWFEEISTNIFYNFVVLFSLLIGGIILFLFVVRALIRKNLVDSKNIALILGSEDSGKTALFLHLRNGFISETLPSLKINSDKFIVPKISQSKEIEFLDYPGNSRLSLGIKNFFKKSFCVIFLIDMSSKSSIRNSAQTLYELLTDNTFNEFRLPMLFFFNKCDLNENKKTDALIEDLEKEIERIRASRGITLDEEDNLFYLGFEGESFKLEQIPVHLQVGKGSVKNGEVEDVLNFLRNFI